jgi:hypothetical protein
VTAVNAQAPRLEVSVSGGFAGAEGEPPPNLATVGGTVSVRFTRHWWASWSGNFGPGSRPDQYPGGMPPPFPQFDGDRRYLRSGRLSLQHVTVSYHASSTGRLGLIAGGGLLISAGFDRSLLLANTVSDIRPLKVREPWSGFSLHAFIRYRLSRRLSLDPGIVIDSSFDRSYYQPLVRVTLGL